MPATARFIRIETAKPGLAGADPTQLDWRAIRGAEPAAIAYTAPDGDWRFPDRLLRELHHGAYGRPWIFGRVYFDFLVAAGVRPGDTVLDFGCGTGRLGTLLIPYLGSGRYFGIESHPQSLECFACYEAYLHDLNRHAPRLYLSRHLDIDHFGTRFDVVLDFHASTHLSDAERTCLHTAFAACLTDGGRVFSVPGDRMTEAELQAAGLRSLDHGTLEAPMLGGHAFDAASSWRILGRTR